MKSTLIRFGVLALMISALAGCGGSDGTAGAPGAPGTPGTPGVGGPVQKAANMTAAQWLALKPNIDPASITFTITGGKPVVNFTVTDVNGNPLVGLGLQRKASTALVPTNYNLQFTLAKLVPATSTAPSKWVSYLVTNPGTVASPATTGSYPRSDTAGTMVDNGDGTYQYTFWRDITATKAFVDGLTDNAAAGKLKADLGDTTYEPGLTHRLGIIVDGSQPGTGTNTPNAVQVTNPVPLVNTFNIGYDFVPGGGAVTTTRDIVKKDSCSGCHAGKNIGHVTTASATNGIPPGSVTGRNDPRLCVTCHTDQTKYGYVEVTATTNLDGSPAYSGTYGRVNGDAAFTYPRMIHQFHMGAELVKTGYNLNSHCNTATGANLAACYNLVGFPQSQTDCTKCHDGSATKSDGSVNANQTANGDNWKNAPNRMACGACHDGINFATGTGITLADRNADVAALLPVGTTQSGHGPGVGPLTDDSTCGGGSCHTATNIAVMHESTVPTLNNPIVKAGVSTITYDLKSVTLNGTNQPVVTFRINKDGSPVTTLNTTTASPVPASFEAITGLTRGPTIYVAYAVTQDGITSPADFNGRVGASLSNLLTSGAVNAGTFANVTVGTGTITTTDTNGYFTATLTGPSTALITIPAGAKMVTGLMVGRFEQVVGGVTVKIKPVLKTVVATITGNTGRRVIVSMAKCNNCHEQLGTSPEFHNGERNDPTACAICHTPNQINDGLSATTNYGWAGASNTYIHGIHAASKRSVPYTWAVWDFPNGLSSILYPGILKNCEQCHLPGTVNFGATGTSVAPNMLYTTASAGLTVAAGTAGLSPYVVPGQDYGLPASVDTAGVLTPAAATTLVNSPMASACFACHDTALAKAHMTSNGGAIYEARSTALLKTETCLVCHGVGRVADVAVVHQQ